MIVVDTNLLSEWMKPRPTASVMRWTRLMPADRLYTTAVTEAEARHGIAREDDGRRKRDHEALVEYIFSNSFAGRILPFDSAAAKAYAVILVRMQRRGRTFSKSDAQIAAIAAVNGAAIATRDSGFAHCGVPLIDPWNT